MAISLAFLPLLLACGGASSMREIRQLRATGKADEACSAAQKMAVGPKRARSVQLEAMRFWVGCEARRGMLARVGAALAQRGDGLGLYGRALLAVAGDPPRPSTAHRLMLEAAKAWPQQAEIPYRHGLILLQDGRAKAAQEVLGRACALRMSASCQIALAHVLLDLGRSKEAMEAARRALEGKPTPTDIIRGRALVRRRILRQQRMPKEAGKSFASARRALFRQKQPAEALRLLSQLRVDHPQLAAAHLLAGAAHLRLDNGALALEALRRAAQLNPVDASAPFLLGTLYETRSRLDKAELFYRRAMVLDPFDARPPSRLCKVLERRGDHRGAAVVYRRLALLDRTHATLREAGRSHLKAGLWGEAERYYGEVLAAEPNDFEAHLRLGQLLMRQLKGESDPSVRARARRHAREAAKVRPKDPEVLRLLQAL